MRKLNPDYLYAVREIINNCPYFRLLSMNAIFILYLRFLKLFAYAALRQPHQLATI